MLYAPFTATLLLPAQMSQPAKYHTGQAADISKHTTLIVYIYIHVQAFIPYIDKLLLQLLHDNT